ncbi:pyridoxamine 5'-phosphate oxidase family protein [Iodidimonas sp. SYSU 1G8]|uniref:pyridoxamine 5'-phosphate oxidase family protein n=1 Tax=Iodidimonas sp. SYSU 1G8 TaxID=3133967 RepID=UPI0031FE6EBF
MAQFYPALDEALKKFIAAQDMFFVATAPGEGRVNLSPKGMDTFRVIDDSTVAYLDLTGSGNETAAHLRDNGRITIMWCSFTGTAKIVRIFGTGRSVRPGAAEFDGLLALFPDIPGTRQIMLIDVDQAQTSCGYSVPQYELVRERPTLVKWAETKTEEELRAYWARKNTRSIDGLPTGIFDE